MNVPVQSQPKTAATGFTLVELLIAMTITLLMMAGLAKSFAVIGESIKSGRSQVTLSSKMRGISYRMRSDLRSRTCSATPPITTEEGAGYFLYYEGPLTEHTFGLFGAEPTRTLESGEVLRAGDTTDSDSDMVPDFFDPDVRSGPTYRRLAQYGDFDDYIAFTAEAPGNDWFTGKVPAYLVDDDAVDPMEPRIIRSKYAEIIVWAAPRWQVDAASNTLQLANHPSAMPLYQDDNNDLAPDEIVLHQRILLIRPDLNVPRTLPGMTSDSEVLRPLLNDTNAARVPAALESLYPIGIVNPASTATPVPAPKYGSYVVTGSDLDNRLMHSSNWLVGMTPLHHFFDLSLRRVLNPVTGDPTGYVAANSLKDLVQPHNRFAHVRYPGRYMNRGTFGGGDLATSMPLLAVGWNDFLLSWQGTADPRGASATAPSWFPTGHPSSRTRNGAGTATTADDSFCGLFNGWLLPQFELGDANPAGTSDGGHWERGYLAVADPRWDRTGEDVIAGNLLAFDVKGFDVTAPVFVTVGPDGMPGQITVDDDGSGTVDETVPFTGLSELGTVGSDDTLIQVGDLGIANLMGLSILDPSNSATFAVANPVDEQALSSRGAFVDLLYPYLGGSPLLQRTAQTGALCTPAPAGAVTAVPQVTLNYSQHLQSELSLYPIPGATITGGLNSLKRSGKLLHSDTAGNIWFFQPAYDTWTDHFEFDGFDQTQTANGEVTGGFQVGTTWVLNDTTGLNQTPRMTSSAQPALQIDTGRWVPNEPETSPPIAVPLRAVSITVRLTDSAGKEITQFTVVEPLQ
jgi:hypothetical protein